MFLCYIFHLPFMLDVNSQNFHFNSFYYRTLSLPSVTPSSSSHHGRSSPGGGLPVHRHPRWHRPTAVPRGSAPDLPLWPPLLEEKVHSLQGERCLDMWEKKSRGFLCSMKRDILMSFWLSYNVLSNISISQKFLSIYVLSKYFVKEQHHTGPSNAICLFTDCWKVTCPQTNSQQWQ